MILQAAPAVGTMDTCQVSSKCKILEILIPSVSLAIKNLHLTAVLEVIKTRYVLWTCGNIFPLKPQHMRNGVYLYSPLLIHLIRQSTASDSFALPDVRQQ